MTNTLFPRLLALPENQSLFLFGARNTGKSTMMVELYDPQKTLFINLLKAKEFARFQKDPDELSNIVKSLPDTTTNVVIDEIQKIPQLLDVVHSLIAETNKRFIMTGSSARKLRQGGANLLAGRAFVYHLYPLTHIELGDKFNLMEVLHWGSLPNIFKYNDNKLREEFLFAYAHTYLKEEIWEEQFVKNLDPFRRFLEVAAQTNGKQINYANIARDVGVSDKTITTYYSILEDTLIGFFLEAYHGSFRKRLSKQPKFYLFDIGVTRALAFLTDIKLAKQTNAYGNAFEHFIILECKRLADYHRLRYKFSYLRTQEGVEIDLIIERPGKTTLCIEIKSAEEIAEHDISSFITVTKDFQNSEAICISNDQYSKKIQHVTVLPWRVALELYFCTSVM